MALPRRRVAPPEQLGAARAAWRYPRRLALPAKAADTARAPPGCSVIAAALCDSLGIIKRDFEKAGGVLGHVTSRVRWRQVQ